MTITIASDTGKRYAGWAIAHDKTIISADVIKIQAAPNIHPPTYRQGQYKQPDCDLAWRIAEAIRRDFLVKAVSHTDVEIITEIPTYRDKRAKKLGAGDLAFVTLTAGAISYAVPNLGFNRRVRFIEPSEWKGQAPDEACWKRIEDALTADERTRVGEMPLRARLGGDWHHAFESVGILLWSMFRI